MPFLSWVGVDFSVTAPLNLQGAGGAAPVFGAGAVGDAFNRTEIRSNGTIAFGSGAAAPTQTMFRSATAFTFNFPLDISNVGSGLQVAEGTNAKQGTAVLSAGTVVVSNTAVTASSRIFITLVALGTVTVPSAYGVSARTAGTSFTILASQATDTSTVAYEIFEPG